MAKKSYNMNIYRYYDDPPLVAVSEWDSAYEHTYRIPIEGHEHRRITPCGTVLINDITEKFIKECKRADDYLYCHKLYKHNEDYTGELGGKHVDCIAVHRLMAAAAIPLGEHLDGIPFIPHHIDHNKENNCRDNLELCTYAENTRRARAAGRFPTTLKKTVPLSVYSELLPYDDEPVTHYMGKSKAKAVEMKNSVSGEVTRFKSLRACASAIGVKETWVSKKVHDPRGQDYVHQGYQFRPASDEAWEGGYYPDKGHFQCARSAHNAFK